MSSLFLQGLVFSGLATGILAFLAWWLYFSPLKQLEKSGASAEAQSRDSIASSPRLFQTLALLVGISALLICVGGYWDLSEHVVTGIVPGGEDFLWPPHLMIYAGFLFAFLVAVGGLSALAIPNLRAGVIDPRRWVRSNPYVGATVLVAGYGIFSIPGDAIWHELYGIDLTAWSPPHILIAISSATLPVFAAGLLIGGRNRGVPSRSKTETRGRRRLLLISGIAEKPARHPLGERLSRPDWRSFVNLLYLAMALCVFLIIGASEWEMDEVRGYVAQRPVWLYPTIIGVSAFFLSVLARRIAPGPWTATAFALFYFGLRIAATSFADVVSGTMPRLTLVFILGAVLLDLTCQWMDRFGFKPGDWQVRLAASGAFMVGYTVVAQPTIEFLFLSYLPHFTVPDHFLTALFVFLLSAALYPVPMALGSWLRNSGREETATQQDFAEALTVPAKG
ncbi:MAG: hypothetical protein F4Y42_01890 [Caldilineaceae bacterium SB0664_bin_27]|uniref:Uncharacterized protein n=1 Tax=Caldilineaceae bacterium SB0664_bin_27 TaxID=2605260 RepID=A0A6B0YQE2_9CHLR|nr:hypothetical protein [Caldilineaceae bacterium SB0664_bin_27]